MNIGFITYDYPSKARPFYGAFVRNIVRAIARTGTRCTVINPVSIFHKRYGPLDPEVSWDAFIRENPIEVRKPRYFSASDKTLLFFNTEYITHNNFYKAVKRTLEELKPTPDILYGHFIFPSGAVVAQLGSLKGITSIMAVGEDTEEDFIKKHRMLKTKWDIGRIDGVIAVSSVNKRRCIEELLIPDEKIIVLPNGIDFSLFYPRERSEMRKKYGLPNNRIIIAFVGHFDTRKGPNRILESVEGLDNIGVVFIGAGTINLTGNSVLFKGVLEHERVPEMLSAADFFVLPTLSEGSCNAILEAMACGLPVITSKNDFNDDIIGNGTAFRIDPLDTKEIRNAIIRLSSNSTLREEMSSKALIWARGYDVNKRAAKILEWMRRIRKGTSKSTLMEQST
jgi:teichuronic acid biosynthesis glycosyltransferase TuaC